MFSDLQVFIEETFYGGNTWDRTAWKLSITLAHARAWNKANQKTEKFKLWRKRYRSREDIKAKRREVEGSKERVLGIKFDLTGQVFGRWSVIEFHDTREQDRTTMWLCKCECGTIRAVRASPLRFGRSKSCGCLHRFQSSVRMKILSGKQKLQREGKIT